MTLSLPSENAAPRVMSGPPDDEKKRNRNLFVVVSYDIANDGRRTRVMKLLKNYGRHVQESVFECDLHPTALSAMRERLVRLIAPREDNLRFYFLDDDAVRKIEVIGTNPVAREQPFYIIELAPRAGVALSPAQSKQSDPAEKRARSPGSRPNRRDRS